MYGLIHEALQGHVRTSAGDAAWEAVLVRAGVDGAVFHSMTQYPDDLTLTLVSCASEVLSVPAAELLRTFGRYWAVETAPKHYGPLMQFTGRSFAEFLSNLDRMHDRVATIFLNLKQPSFAVEQVGDGLIRLHYRSQRRGLAPFVVGLLEGLAERFRVRLEIEHEQSLDGGADHDVFVLRYEPL